MREKPAKGVRGFLLWSPVANRYFFRVYRENHEFIDYDLDIEELEVEILDDCAVLRNGRLTWADEVLMGKPGERQVRVSVVDGKRVEVRGHLNDKMEFIPD